MFEVIYKEKLNKDAVLMRVRAPRIATARKAGQFIIIQVDELGERFPLTIADADLDEGSVTIVFQILGKSTMKLAAIEEGGMILNLLGPLGKPTEISLSGHVAVIGGGVGMAPLLPITRALKNAGNRITAIAGGRSAENIILADKLKDFADSFITCTDDGSMGIKGNVLKPLGELIKNDRPDQVVAIGPLPMMHAVCDFTRNYNIETMVSLNPIMVDGTGMCGGCRVNVNSEVKFACVDGPEFNGHQVDFNSLKARNNQYRDIQNNNNHKCRAVHEKSN